MQQVKIIYDDFEGELDQLDDVTLKDGELLLVEFPDATLAWMRVEVKAYERD